MRGACLLFLLCLGGCAATPGRSADPYFDRAWSDDLLNRGIQTREDYLKWIDSFYEGSTFVPGWSRRQAELCESLDRDDAAAARVRLETLGRLLASEWAKDNRVRRIDTSALVRIAGILGEAREGGRLLAAVDELLEVAGSIIAGEPRLQTMRR